MKLKLLITMLLMSLLGSVVFIAYQYTQGQKITPEISIINKISRAPTVVPSPTPTPVLIDQSSDLKTETEKLTPEDFSNDFKNLKEEASKL